MLSRMDSEIIAALIGTAVATTFGIAGFVTALVSNSRAKKANDAAKRANDIATDALAQAVEANQIAENANELSADANTLVSRQAEQRTEQHITEWVLDAHEKRSPTLTLRQLGRDTAYRVSIGIRGKSMYEVSDGHGDAAQASEITVTLPQSVQDGLGKVRVTGFVGDIKTYSEVVQRLTIEVHWFTALGNPREKTLEVKVK